MQIQTKSIINNLFQVTITCDGFQAKAIAENQDEAIQKALQRLLQKIDQCFELTDYFEITLENRLAVFKIKIPQLAGLADHYYLSESRGLKNSIGWGPQGIELRGKVCLTLEQINRIKQFMSVARYNIEIHNCEHFANYVLYGLNLSTQKETLHKNIGAKIVSQLQPKQTITENILTELSENLKHKLKIEKAKRTKQKIYDFCQTKGIDCSEALSIFFNSDNQ